MEIASKDDLIERLSKHSFYHRIDMGDGVVTPGHEWLRHAIVPTTEAISKLDLKGKRVLDVGCCDGLHSLQAERMGASETIAIDNSLSRGAVEVVLPWLKSKIKMSEINFYDFQSEDRFDLVIFAGVLYHLRMPFLAIKRLAEMTNPGGSVIIETALYLNTKHSVLYCPKASASPYEATSVTFFSHDGLVSTFESMGFSDVECTAIIVEAPGTPKFANWAEFAESDLYKNLARDDTPVIGRGTFSCKRSAVNDDRDDLLNRYWYGSHSLNTVIDATEKKALKTRA